MTTLKYTLSFFLSFLARRNFVLYYNIIFYSLGISPEYHNINIRKLGRAYGSR